MKYLHEKQMQIGGDGFVLTFNYNKLSKKFTVYEHNTIKLLKIFIKRNFEIPEHLQHLSINFYEDDKTLESLGITNDTTIIVNKMNFILIRFSVFSELETVMMPLNPDFLGGPFIDLNPQSMTVLDLKKIVIQQPFTNQLDAPNDVLLERTQLELKLKFKDIILENDERLADLGIKFDDPTVIIDYSFRQIEQGKMLIKIHILGVKNPFFYLEISPTDTIGYIKELIFKKTSLPIDKLRIIFNRVDLEDKRILDHYNVRPYNTLLVNIIV